MKQSKGKYKVQVEDMADDGGEVGEGVIRIADETMEKWIPDSVWKLYRGKRRKHGGDEDQAGAGVHFLPGSGTSY